MGINDRAIAVLFNFNVCSLAFLGKMQILFLENVETGNTIRQILSAVFSG